jgi:hypothetical protein
MRKSRVRVLRKLFLAMYASAEEEATEKGIEIEKHLPMSTAWRIFKKQYLKHRNA